MKQHLAKGPGVQPWRQPRPYRVYGYDRHGKLVKTWTNRSAAAFELGVKVDAISVYVAHGYMIRKTWYLSYHKDFAVVIWHREHHLCKLRSRKTVHQLP